jgi:hypothetical protein
MAGLHVSIPVDTREYFRLTDDHATLYIFMNYMASALKILSLPRFRDRGSGGKNAYSKCEMYNITGPMVWAGNTSDVNVTSK